MVETTRKPQASLRSKERSTKRPFSSTTSRIKPVLSSVKPPEDEPETQSRSEQAQKSTREEEPQDPVSANDAESDEAVAADREFTTTEQAEPLDHVTVLRNRPFIIRALRYDGGGDGQVTGSILSQTLDKVLLSAGNSDVGALTMAGLRKLVPGMSRYTNIDKFCTPSGTSIDDEAISFLDYLNLEGVPEESASKSGAASVRLYFRSTSLGASAGKGADGESAAAVQAPNLADGPSVKADGAPEVDILQLSADKHDLIDSSNFAEFSSGADDNPGAGTLNENQWAVVLRNCAVFYGWAIDPRSRQIVRAPKPAFQLRSKVNHQDVAKIPDFLPQAAVAKTAGKDLTGLASVTAKSDLFGGAPPASMTGIGSGELTPPTLSDMTEDGDLVGTGSDKVENEGDPSSLVVSSDSVSIGSSNHLADVDDEAKKTPVVLVPRSNKGIPNFRVNDDSRIEVTAHESELSVSMARSDFSEQSTEASVSGGGYGVSVGVSAGYGSNKGNTSKQTTGNTTRTLVARYMFPRCDLIMWPDELEPTPELAQLIDTIRTTKNIKALRRLHIDFGQLFCQRVTLGGRLLSTKVINTKETKSMDEEKQSFKTSVGASVSGSYAGFSASASVKHEQSSGSTNLNEASARTQDDAAVFEAVGGDTILANNPVAWGPTVGRYDYWRVINVSVYLYLTVWRFANQSS
jgi:hypothetical protein